MQTFTSPPQQQEEQQADKYQQKYKEIKKRIRDTELENDELISKLVRLRRNIYRLRLERKFLCEKLGEDDGNDGSKNDGTDGTTDGKNDEKNGMIVEQEIVETTVVDQNNEQDKQKLIKNEKKELDSMFMQSESNQINELFQGI